MSLCWCASQPEAHPGSVQCNVLGDCWNTILVALQSGDDQIDCSSTDLM
jgi:hypothetical protein